MPSVTTKKLLVLSMLAACLSHSDAVRLLRGGSKSLDEQQHNQIHPSPHLNIDLVVEAISNHLYYEDSSSNNDNGESLPTFVVAGSYPSALKAYEHDHTFILPYNDIDVFISRADPKDPECEHRRIQTTYYRSDIIPDMEVNFVYSCFNSMEQLVSDFDINGIKTGFEVVPTFDLAAQKMVGTIDFWYVDPSYEEFLQTRVLAIVNAQEAAPARGLSVSLIRLLRKAGQLQLDYKIWDTEKLRALMHGSTFGAKTMGKLEKLPKNLQNEVYSRFNVWELRKGRYMLVLKEEDPPAPNPVAIARKLRVATCEYDGDCETTPAPTPSPTAPPTGVPADSFTIIHHVFANLAVTVSSCNLGTPVTLEPYNAQNQGQQWTRGPGNSIVSVRCPDRVLDVRARNCETADIILWSHHGGTNQQWDVTDVTSTVRSFGALFAIQNVLCHDNLDVPWGTVNGARVTLNAPGGGLQEWRVRNIDV